MAISGLISTLLLVGVHSGNAFAEQSHEETTQENSAKLAKPLKEAQDGLKAKNYPEAIEKLKEAERTAGKTPYDQHLINDMLAFAYIKTSSYADAAEAMEAQIDDGFTPQSDVAQKVRALAQINYQLKNYDKAIKFGNRAINGGFADEAIRAIVGQAYYLKGDWEGTLKFEEEIVDNQIKAGQSPKSETLQLILSSCVKLNDNACEKRARERLRRYYPRETPL
jgi:tetratricopeptide (TPR) repeat protein